MNILILSRKPSLFFNQKVEKIAKATDMKVTIIDPLNCELFLNADKSIVYVNGKPLEKADFVIPRMSLSIMEYGLSVLRHFELLNIPALNSSYSIQNVLNRFEYLQFLSGQWGIKTPKSVLIRKSNQIKTALTYINGPPSIIKIISEGNKLGAMLVEKTSTLESLFDVSMVMGGIGQIGQNIILEEFIKEANGKSMHLLVLNNEVLGSYYRHKSFQSKQAITNINKPALELTTAPKEFEEMALKAVNMLKLDFALVGILESYDGPKLFEIDINPDIDVFERDSEIQVIPRMLTYCVSKYQEATSIRISS